MKFSSKKCSQILQDSFIKEVAEDNQQKKLTKNEEQHQFIQEFWEFQKDYNKLIIEFQNKQQDEQRMQMYEDGRQMIKDLIKQKKDKQTYIMNKITRVKEKMKEKA